MLKGLFETCKAIISKSGRSFSNIANSISEGMKEIKEKGLKEALPEITDEDIAAATIRKTSIAVDIARGNENKDKDTNIEESR